VLGGLNGGVLRLACDADEIAVNSDLFVARLANAGTLAVRRARAALTVWPSHGGAGNGATAYRLRPAVALPLLLRNALGQAVAGQLLLSAGRQTYALPPGLALASTCGLVAAGYPAVVE
jgi:hypothetical protein